MAISKKNKNRALVDGKEYLWWVFDKIDQTTFDGLQIKAVCSDQTHFYEYGLQQEPTNRILVIALKNHKKLMHLSQAPKFENDEGIMTRTGIISMIQWSKKKHHHIQYALDGESNALSQEQKTSVLQDIQKYINTSTQHNL